MNRISKFVLVLLLALSICSHCSASSPSPTLFPTGMNECITLSVSGLASEPRKHILYSQDSWRVADGILMFAPLEEYVNHEPIDTISRDQFLTAKLSIDNYVESVSLQTAYFRRTEDGLESLKSVDVPSTSLPEKTYLIRMDIAASGQGNAVRFYYLFWLK